MKVSVITAVKNGAETLRGCIESVQKQTVPAEHIIIDGASTDSTFDIIAQYRSSIGKVISEPDKGIYDALNKGFGWLQEMSLDCCMGMIFMPMIKF